MKKYTWIVCITLIPLCIGLYQNCEGGSSSPFGNSPFGSGDGLTASVSDAFAAQGENLNFKIQLNRAHSDDLEVWYKTNDNTAVGGSHYTSVDTSVVISQGDSEVTVQVASIMAGSQQDTNFTIELTSVSAGGIGQATAAGLIQVGQFLRACHEIKQSNTSAPDGTYYIDPDGDGGAAPFEVYCDMTTGGGGWTLVDNDASTTATFTSRVAGANSNLSVTRGSYLPDYYWSAAPQLMVKSSFFTGSVGWVSFNALDTSAMEYPVQTTTTATGQGSWSYSVLNGNTAQGLTPYIYNGSGRYGSIWIGNGSQPTAACGYTSLYIGLGLRTDAGAATCSTWVR